MHTCIFLLPVSNMWWKNWNHALVFWLVSCRKNQRMFFSVSEVFSYHVALLHSSETLWSSGATASAIKEEDKEGKRGGHRGGVCTKQSPPKPNWTQSLFELSLSNMQKEKKSFILRKIKFVAYKSKVGFISHKVSKTGRWKKFQLKVWSSSRGRKQGFNIDF